MSSKKENLRIKSIKSKSSSLKTDNTLKKNLELNSFDSKNNQIQVTLSQKQTIASSDYENYSRKSSKKTEETKSKCTTYELLELVQKRREEKLLSPIKEGKVIKSLLTFSCDNLKKKITKISYDLSNVKNNEFRLNTLNKKNNTLKIIEISLGKNYKKEIEKLRNKNNILRNKINELEHETFNSNELYNKMKNEVENMKKKNVGKSDEVNELIEKKKQLQTLLFIYQKKIKEMKEIVYNQVKTDNNIKSGLQTMLENME